MFVEEREVGRRREERKKKRGRERGEEKRGRWAAPPRLEFFFCCLSLSLLFDLLEAFRFHIEFYF
jgi:hypothetical protein